MNETRKSFPLDWPVGQPRTPKHRIDRAKFGTRSGALTTTAGIKRVLDELRKMRVPDFNTIISSNVPTRLHDGLPRSMRAEPPDTGVAVYFRRGSVLKLERYVLACDKWNRVADNLAAIAAHLGALRGQERWGVGTQDQAFAGYKALAAPDAVKPWWQVLGFAVKPTDAALVKQKYRDLAMQHHPDRGGDPSQMAEIAAAYDESCKEVRP